MTTEPWGGPPDGDAPLDVPVTQVGDISISERSVFVPGGRHPIRGSVWTVQDLSRVEEKISTTGIVLAVVFVWFCLLGLLFLLMKERRHVGFIQVTVQGDGFHHQTMVPVAGPQTLASVLQVVGYARSLAVQ
jgi:hypothetical protein